MDQYDRYSPGTHVVNKSNGRSYSVLRDYGEGPSRTLEVKTTSGATLAIAAVSVRKDPRPFPETSTPTQPQTPRVNSKTIYQHKKEDGSVVMGTYLATDKMGQVVLELLGAGGAVIVVDPKTVEEVRPYTFAAVSLTDESKVFEFIYLPDVLKRGDLLIPENGSETVRVVNINTKSNTAKERFRGRRITTEEVLP